MFLDLILYILLLLLSFYLLIKCAEYLISCASIIGDRNNVSRFAIGLSAIAIGTSLPELMTSIIGIISSKNGEAFVFGTIIGSNISNILLIFATLLVFSKIFKFKLKIIDSIYLLSSSIILIIIMLIDGINYIVGFLFLLLFASYLYFGIKKSNPQEIIEEFEEETSTPLNKYSTKILILIFIISLSLLNIGAKGVVYGIEKIGLLLNIPINYLTLSSVAFATSLPELVVTYQAAIKKEFDLAIGNIFGSNISNIFLIIGISSIFKTLNVNILNYYSSLSFLLISVILFLSIQFIKSENFKIIGIIFYLLYILYILLIFL